MNSAKQRSPELKFHFEQGPELSEEEIDGIAMVLARMIHQQIISDSTENSFNIKKYKKSRNSENTH